MNDIRKVENFNRRQAFFACGDREKKAAIGGKRAFLENNL